MYVGSMELAEIIRAFERHVPGVYVRDYRDSGGYITICRYYKNIKWGDQLSTAKVERQVPAVTLGSYPRGFVTSADLYNGLRLARPGWRSQFRKAMRYLTSVQMRKITKELRRGEVFPGVV